MAQTKFHVTIGKSLRNPDIFDGARYDEERKPRPSVVELPGPPDLALTGGPQDHTVTYYRNAQGG